MIDRNFNLGKYVKCSPELILMKCSVLFFMETTHCFDLFNVCNSIQEALET